jgi:hypothetical protein
MKREIRTLIIHPSIMPQIASPKLNVQLEEQKKRRTNMALINLIGQTYGQTKNSYCSKIDLSSFLLSKYMFQNQFCSSCQLLSF